MREPGRPRARRHGKLDARLPITAAMTNAGNATDDPPTAHRRPSTSPRRRPRPAPTTAPTPRPRDERDERGRHDDVGRRPRQSARRRRTRRRRRRRRLTAATSSASRSRDPVTTNADGCVGAVAVIGRHLGRRRTARSSGAPPSPTSAASSNVAADRTRRPSTEHAACASSNRSGGHRDLADQRVVRVGRSTSSAPSSTSCSFSPGRSPVYSIRDARRRPARPGVGRPPRSAPAHPCRARAPRRPRRRRRPGSSAPPPPRVVMKYRVTSGWVTVIGPPSRDLALEHAEHRALRAEHVAEPHRHVAADRSRAPTSGRHPLADPLRRTRARSSGRPPCRC